ncbi:MAG: dephospho-CoA kinase [Methylococcales bacterium]
MFKVGLTGGIGAGKTTVAHVFAGLGTPIIDADAVAHALVAKGQPALLSIQEAFGDGVIADDGSLNRAKLRDIIFDDSNQKQRLEAILHPLIYVNLQQQADALKAPYCILAIPLLFETQMSHFVDRIAVVDCPVECQISRVMTRDQLSMEKIQAILNAQTSRAERQLNADDIIDNSNNPNKSLAEQVKTLHNLYLSLSIKHCC